MPFNAGHPWSTDWLLLETNWDPWVGMDSADCKAEIAKYTPQREKQCETYIKDVSIALLCFVGCACSACVASGLSCCPDGRRCRGPVGRFTTTWGAAPTCASSTPTVGGRTPPRS